METYNVRSVSAESSKTLCKLCVLTKFPRWQIMWNFGILRSVISTYVMHLDAFQATTFIAEDLFVHKGDFVSIYLFSIHKHSFTILCSIQLFITGKIALTKNIGKQLCYWLNIFTSKWTILYFLAQTLLFFFTVNGDTVYSCRIF